MASALQRLLERRRQGRPHIMSFHQGLGLGGSQAGDQSLDAAIKLLNQKCPP